ncbi:hypothetical protein AAII07_35690 [Microvirga sp. 0TCS3.31]
MNNPQFWLVVESQRNWTVDQQNGFTYFGIGERNQKLASRIQKGDLIFVYIPGRGCFSDMRRATHPGVHQLRGGGDYERSYPLCISTEPVLTLGPDNWIPIHKVKDQMALFRGRDHWAPMLQTSLRAIATEDANVLQDAMKSGLAS